MGHFDDICNCYKTHLENLERRGVAGMGKNKHTARQRASEEDRRGEARTEMGDEKVKNEAMDIMGVFQVLPRLVVFDLDYTLWPFYCECGPKRKMPSLFPHAKGILHALKDKGIDVAVASRSPTAGIANAFLEKFGVSSMFIAKEICSSSTHKADHFQRINQRTGVPYNAMLFFDDENGNIEAVSKLGVTSVLVRNGVNLEAFREGLSKFSQNFASLERNKQKCTKFSQKPGSSENKKK